MARSNDTPMARAYRALKRCRALYERRPHPYNRRQLERAETHYMRLAIEAEQATEAAD